MARNHGWHGATSAIRVAVLHPTRRTVLTYGDHIGTWHGMAAINCDDGTARYVHPVNIRIL
ncbi:hypothetical protein [Tsukamurella sp. 1534]|uniref:hypothetical protein n=1 Tax=Tsukamurella sp. 1534 TaxID=1151061 RepID=UPI0002E419DA|nr:hypothetical protein [Tsukamurella sp. 1534]